MLESVRSYGRRHPGTFLALCGLAGIVAGRLTRSTVATRTSLDNKDGGGSGTEGRGGTYVAQRAAAPYATEIPSPYGSGPADSAPYGTGPEFAAPYANQPVNPGPTAALRWTGRRTAASHRCLARRSWGPQSRRPIRTLARPDELPHSSRPRALGRRGRQRGLHGPRAPLEAEDGRSIGSVLADITANISTLLRQEVALAKAEVRQSGTQAGKGIGLFAGAGVAGLLLLVFLSVSAWWGLGQYIGNEWSALVVAAVWAIIALILFLAGKAELKRVRGLPDTTETLSKVPNALKGHEEENR